MGPLVRKDIHVSAASPTSPASSRAISTCKVSLRSRSLPPGRRPRSGGPHPQGRRTHRRGGDGSPCAATGWPGWWGRRRGWRRPRPRIARSEPGPARPAATGRRGRHGRPSRRCRLPRALDRSRRPGGPRSARAVGCDRQPGPAAGRNGVVPQRAFAARVRRSARRPPDHARNPRGGKHRQASCGLVAVWKRPLERERAALRQDGHRVPVEPRPEVVGHAMGLLIGLDHDDDGCVRGGLPPSCHVRSARGGGTQLDRRVAALRAG